MLSANATMPFGNNRGCPPNSNKKVIVKLNRKRLVRIDENAFIGISILPRK
jgi:hypothetical protein